MSEVPLYGRKYVTPPRQARARHAELSLRGGPRGKAPTKPHSGLRKHFRPDLGRKSVTLTVGTPMCPYGIAYRRAMDWERDAWWAWWSPRVISVKVLINCFWRKYIYYTNDLLLLVWSICVVIFVSS